jgi:hypothetical protein
MRSTTTATPLIFASAAMVPPPGIAQIEGAWIRQRANGRTRDATDKRASARIACSGADCRARAGPDQSARYRALSRRRAATRKRESANRNGAIHEIS